MEKQLTHLPYDTKVSFSKDIVEGGRAGWSGYDSPQGPPGFVDNDTPTLPYERYSVKITAGETVWDTGDVDTAVLPHCEVGDWEKDVRELDCKWKC